MKAELTNENFSFNCTTAKVRYKGFSAGYSQALLVSMNSISVYQLRVSTHKSSRQQATV